ncbi:MAG TPA: NUDIX domain-containing protein [Candidatus Limnocylindria bacterium]|nr:NUDIX domain-containing protein [Candidatus Limnocylindria bacterium]
MSSQVAVCPHCAARNEYPIACDRCGWRWYANPKPAAGTLVERIGPDGEARVLLLKRAVEPGLGAWDLPAGYLEAGESAEEGALRETREEAGFDIELVRLVGVYSSRGADAISTIYLARPTGEATVQTDAESSEHAWVRRADVPEWLPRMAFRPMATALQDWAEGQFGLPRDW